MIDCLADDVRFVDVSVGRQTVESRGIEAFRELATDLAAFTGAPATRVVNCIATEQPCALRVVSTATIAVDLLNRLDGQRGGRAERCVLLPALGTRITELLLVS